MNLEADILCPKLFTKKYKKNQTGYLNLNSCKPFRYYAKVLNSSSTIFLVNHILKKKLIFPKNTK